MRACGCKKQIRAIERYFDEFREWPQWVLNSSEFVAGVSGKHLALCASLSLPQHGQALKTAEERSTRRTAVSSSGIMILEQRVPALVEWLRC